MSRKKSTISVPIVKNGKDICRLIFRRMDRGRYDIKLNFIENPFQVQMYQLFSQRPFLWDPIDSKSSMSYHYGRDDNPVMIHIKADEKLPGKDQYMRLPIRRLQPPNANQMTMLPLLKIEIPNCILDYTSNYREKSYHKKIEIEKANVIELFMAPEGYFDQDCFQKYPGSLMACLMASIEFFATNTVLSDYQKAPRAVPHEAEERGIVIQNLQGMELFASVFFDERVCMGRKELLVTFIENELAEPILLNSILRERKDGSGYFFGGANFNQLKSLIPMASIEPITDSVAMWDIESGCLSNPEKEKLRQRAIEGRKILTSELQKHNDMIAQEERNLKEAVSLFMKRLHDLRDEYQSKYDSFSANCVSVNADENAWLIRNYADLAEDIYILFLVYTKNKHCIMLRRPIENQPFHGLREPTSVGSKSEYHVWLEYSTLFDVDLFRGDLNRFLGDGKKEPPCYVGRGLLTSNNDNWGGIKERLQKNGYQCGPVEILRITPEVISRQMAANNRLLERIYCRLGYSLV